MEQTLLSKPALIIPHLYLSSLPTARNKKILKEFDITHVLSVYKNFNKRNNEITYFPITDLQDSAKKHYVDKLYSYIPETNSFIHNVITADEPGNVLVHCLAGASRSVTFIAVYLLTLTNASAEIVLKWIKSRRPMASPNDGFRKLLKEYEKSNFRLDERMRLGIDRLMNMNFPFNVDASDCILDFGYVNDEESTFQDVSVESDNAFFVKIERNRLTNAKSYQIERAVDNDNFEVRLVDDPQKYNSGDVEELGVIKPLDLKHSSSDDSAHSEQAKPSSESSRNIFRRTYSDRRPNKAVRLNRSLSLYSKPTSKHLEFLSRDVGEKGERKESKTSGFYRVFIMTVKKFRGTHDSVIKNRNIDSNSNSAASFWSEKQCVIKKLHYIHGEMFLKKMNLKPKSTRRSAQKRTPLLSNFLYTGLSMKSFFKNL